MMKRIIARIMMLIMLLSMTSALAACNNREETGLATENTVAEDEDNKDEADDPEDSESVPENPNAGDVVTSFEPDAEGTIKNDIPLQIERIELYKDGSVMLIPTEDLLKNELDGSEATSLMPFADSGDGAVKELYLYRIGNGGYRAIVALMDDGTVSCINPRALIEDHIIAVKDNLGGRDSYVSVVQEEGEDAYSIIGKTEEGDDVRLDPVILDEDGQLQPAE